MLVTCIASTISAGDPCSGDGMVGREPSSDFIFIANIDDFDTQL